jgi:hypothetical protein
MDRMSGGSLVRLSVSAPLVPRLDACPKCGARLPRVRRADAWVEQTIEGGWMVAYRLVVKSGRPVLAEVRLFPNDPGEPSGSGRWSEDPSAVPPEGIPGRALRAIKLGVPLKRFSGFLRGLERNPTFAKQLLGPFGIQPGSKIVRRRPGRAGRLDSFYLAWAAAYVEQLAAGSRRPVRDLAEHPPKVIRGYVSDGNVTSVATVRDFIHQARVRDLLTDSPPGRAGGELTPKAKQMLKGAKKRRSRPS